MPTQPTRFTTAAAPLSASVWRIAWWTLAAPLGHAAGAQADADLARPGPPAGRRGLLGAAAAAGWPCWLRKSSITSGTRLRREPAVGDAVDLDHRGQRAAAQAGDLLDREQALGVGVVALGDAQVALQGVLDQLRALHVAGRAVADADDVLADRVVAELGVEGGDALDRRPA